MPTLMTKQYILVNHKPVPAADVAAWNAWYSTADRTVAVDDIGGLVVSTVFLGITYNHGGNGQPVLFETMVFHNAALTDYWERCCTWTEAVRMHKRVCAMIRKAIARGAR